MFPQKFVITGYHRYGQNLIDWIYRTVNNEEVLQADNLTQVTIFGTEIHTKGNLNKLLFYSLNAQIASHRTGDIDGQSIYVLDYLANRIQAEIHSKSFNGYKIGLVGTRQERAGSYISSVGEKIKYPAFSTMDMQLSYDNDGLCIFMNAQNLFNSEIYDRGNVPLPGRWAKLGIRFHW
jgi:iron complex outermembrane receptor protein